MRLPAHGGAGRRCDPRRRRRLQGSAGQTTVEWLAVMVGLVALAGVLARRCPASPGRSPDVRTMICKVSGKSCGGVDGPGSGRRDPGHPADPAAPTDGPSIGGDTRDVGAGLPCLGNGVRASSTRATRGSWAEQRLQGRRLATRPTSPCTHRRQRASRSVTLVGLGGHQGRRPAPNGKGKGMASVEVSGLAGRQDELRGQDRSQDGRRHQAATSARRPTRRTRTASPRAARSC